MPGPMTPFVGRKYELGEMTAALDGALAGAGRSNQEIAAELFISPYTVANHVAHIFTKLNVESRTAAATWALTNRVV